MLQNNPLLAQLKQQMRAATKRVEGVVKATDKNFGFLETDSGDSYFIPPPAMKQVLHGDRVEAILHEEGEKTSAEPEKLLAAGLDHFLARVQKHNGRLAVVPDHPSIRLSLRADVKRSIEGAISEGDWVTAQLLRHPLKDDDRGFFARIQSQVSKATDPAAPWHVTLARHALPATAPAPGNSEWALLDENLPRQDLTAKAFFTIDGEKTTDLDDALYIECRPEGGWHLTVAIADPTAYVDARHSADQEARKRGFTVYLPGQSIHMLPAQLAEELCSLQQDQVRPALACTMAINSDGSLGEYHFFAATLRSHARLVYDSVSDWLEGADESAPAPDIASQLQALAEFARVRACWRSQHAARNQDRPDYIFELDETGNVLNIRIESRRIANQMVEEAMIAANTCCADFLTARIGHGVFNVHQAFEGEKIDAALQFLASQDIAVDREVLTDRERYRELQAILESRNDPWLDARLRQFQGLATMTTRPGPHFGLGVPAYATWTSPIRKYGDIINHRLIKAALKAEQHNESLAGLPEPSKELTEYLGTRRRLHRLAERGIRDWLYARFLAPAAKEAQPFSAEVVAITRRGMRVRLVDNGATALIPPTMVHTDQEQVVLNDKEGMVLIGEEPRYRLGDILTVALKEAREDPPALIATILSP